MSMINAAAPYRRDDRQAVRVPVVMPLVEVDVDEKGFLTVALDHEPYSADGSLTRDDLQASARRDRRRPGDRRTGRGPRSRREHLHRHRHSCPSDACAWSSLCARRRPRSARWPAAGSWQARKSLSPSWSPIRSRAPTAPPACACRPRCSKLTRAWWCSWASGPAPSWSAPVPMVVRREPSRAGSRRRPGQPRPHPHRRRRRHRRDPATRRVGRRVGVRRLAAERRLGGRLPSSHPPRRPSHRARCRRTRSVGLLARAAAHGLSGRRQRPGAVATDRLDEAQDVARPPPPCRSRHRPRRTSRGLAEGAARAWPDAATVARQARALRRRLPPRPLPRSGRLGVGRGLDPAARTAPLGQGPARRHQRDPRRTRRGHHHRDPTRQHRRHPHRPPGARPGRGLRPATTGRGSTRRPSLVTRARLRRPAHRDDPSHRPRLRHRPVDRRRRVRRLLGRQDPHRPPGAAPRRRARQPQSPRAVRLDALAVSGGRRGGDLVEQPEGCTRLGRLAGVDDPLRPPHPRLDLDGRLPRPVLPRRPPRPRRRVPEPGRALRPRRLPHQQRHPLPARHRRRSWRLLVTRRGLHRRPRRDRPPPRRRLARRTPGPTAAAGARRDRQPLAAAVPAGPHGRRRRHRDHHHARAPVALPGPRQVGRPRGRRDLGRLHRQGHPRRHLLSEGPPRPLRPDRRARREDRHRLRRRLRLPVAPTLRSGECR